MKNPLLFSRMTASAWDKFVLLSWKNWIIQLRHPIQTIFEVLVPVLVCSLLILIRGLTEVKDFPNEFRYPSQSVSNISRVIQIFDGLKVLAYSPNNPLLASLIAPVALEYEFLPVGFDTAVELQNYAQTFGPFASVEFDDSYKVRQNEFDEILKAHSRFLGYHSFA